MLEYFDVLVRAWATYPELRQERTSLLNFNFIICNFLLMIDPREYELHSPWFTQVTPVKLAKLQVIWNTYCQKLGWPVYQAVYDAEGRLHRVRQYTYNVITRVVRRPTNRARKTKQLDIRDLMH